MADEVDYQFPQKPEQCRRAGARGGKATARQRRERLKETATRSPQQEARCATAGAAEETVAVAIAILDVQFPWLRGVEQRLAPH